ncbi:hypothetical protein VKT23_017250 [Stygiomarasmius scandens]|uniref:Heterokaryon incompatibility domain-containing protein n=1 Tax=Marasmiellus scandens TaxID=2682957 RepID=A0ABR1ISF9_9AGAR
MIGWKTTTLLSQPVDISSKYGIQIDGSKQIQPNLGPLSSLGQPSGFLRQIWSRLMYGTENFASTRIALSSVFRPLNSTRRVFTLLSSIFRARSFTRSVRILLFYVFRPRLFTRSLRIVLSDIHRSHRIVHRQGDKTTATKNPLSPPLMASINICPHRFIDTDTLKLVEFQDNITIPPYAILSHRWILDEEVVYDEFTEPSEETLSKSGYHKIQAACRQARHDSIRYIWIDTCCIQQGKHDDVVANITSMYAYYQNAEVCYVYLVDVLERKDMVGKVTSWNVEGGSEWFSRGWTLQELVAPRNAIFFNKIWQPIGDKHELRDDISHITTIPFSVLSGEESVQDVNVLTRMSWALWRKTTKKQDKVYCLQGLLGVSVKPDYDEYWITSWNRLGLALLDAQPELKQRLGIDDSDEMFHNSSSRSFYNRVWRMWLYTRPFIFLPL